LQKRLKFFFYGNLINLMIKKFLRRGSRGRNNFQNVPPSAGLEVFAGETFFSRRVKKARGFTRKTSGFRLNTTFFPPFGRKKHFEIFWGFVFSPAPSFKNFLGNTD